MTDHIKMLLKLSESNLNNLTCALMERLGYVNVPKRAFHEIRTFLSDGKDHLFQRQGYKDSRARQLQVIQLPDKMIVRGRLSYCKTPPAKWRKVDFVYTFPKVVA